VAIAVGVVAEPSDVTRVLFDTAIRNIFEMKQERQRIFLFPFSLSLSLSLSLPLSFSPGLCVYGNSFISYIRQFDLGTASTISIALIRPLPPAKLQVEQRETPLRLKRAIDLLTWNIQLYKGRPFEKSRAAQELERALGAALARLRKFRRK